ncbi:MAG: DUF262 domain-containing protein [Paraclostridium sp.]
MNLYNNEEWKVDNTEIEEENDSINDNVDEQPFDADKIRVDQKPISVRQMYDMIKYEQLNLSPRFQRRQVWKENKRKSLLIESLMLRIPLPVFYVYEDDSSVWHVVDGLQRMSTIYDFMNDEFKLTGLEYLNNSLGKVFGKDGNAEECLEQKYRNRIEQTTLMINVVDARTPTQVKYDIFRRINTGGVPLTPQEIRNSIAKEKIRVLLEELIDIPNFKVATRHIKDTRMQAQELILRFIAFLDVYDFETGEVLYKNGMNTFLDLAFDRLNNSSDKKLNKYRELFTKSMNNCSYLFEDIGFRRVNTAKKKMPINRSLFTCLSVVLAYYDIEYSEKIRFIGKEEIVKELRNNEDFDSMLVRGPVNKNVVEAQFKYSKQLIERILNKC